jgi:hypothetical protein
VTAISLPASFLPDRSVPIIWDLKYPSIRRLN